MQAPVSDGRNSLVFAVFTKPDTASFRIDYGMVLRFLRFVFASAASFHPVHRLGWDQVFYAWD
jgi:hypothetical protein